MSTREYNIHYSMIVQLSYIYCKAQYALFSYIFSWRTLHGLCPKTDLYCMVQYVELILCIRTDLICLNSLVCIL